MSAQPAAAKVALFSPYLGGISRQQALASALTTLGEGAAEGERPVEDREGHRFRLSWQAGLAPLEPVECELVFPGLPDVRYSFTVACYELVGWLMDWHDQPEPRDLPQRFWQWLILGST
ncbi:transglycosylase [Synechococcus sp. RSCCF101]|uniref:type IV pilus biogenesis protein EbsA n=1 Tax=Synechococcus sp. RSCCF101 TaxID=2511069 RepID=UPI001246E6B3|nr:type IV pilus biogenesis protein EbsA [Synechococcus sp. RSCCF101]QEY32023.1 transglycosylase [Synechococcus sp. RSCCF101]